VRAKVGVQTRNAAAPMLRAQANKVRPPAVATAAGALPPA